MDDNRAFRRPPTPEAQLEGLTLFEGPAPSQPGSASSEDAADAISDPMRRKDHKKILWALFTVTSPRSMAEICKRTGLTINVVCARLDELRPLWIERHDRACVSSVKPSLRVDGYTLTDAAKRRVQEALDKAKP